MIYTCSYCHTIKRGTEGEISHGICFNCSLLFYGHYRPALPPSSSIIPDIFPTDMDAKIATRFDDCIYCHYRDLDGDGVPDGCLAPRGTCIAPGRRSPWKY